MTERTDFTVVLYTRNQAGLLPMALAHLELQTFPAAWFETIVIDDGSTDGTIDMLERYAAGTPIRIRTLRTEGIGPAAARNRATGEALGQWVLFLDTDLLAGPELVEAHARAQEAHGGACAVAGRIDFHPQIERRQFTRQYNLASVRIFNPHQPLHFLDWRVHNLSLPRHEYLNAGGFLEKYPFAGLEDLELAGRLANGGLAGFYSDEACAYVWRGTNLRREAAQYYAEGYWLPYLMGTTETTALLARYRRYFGVFRTGCAVLAGPLVERVMPYLAGNTRVFNLLSRSVLCRHFRKGYSDARHGRAPARAVQGQLP